MIARRQRRQRSILDAIADPHLFGQHFAGDTWLPWLAFLCALFALPMTQEQLALYQQHTGRTNPASEALHEAWLICGRRAGKSFILALIAVFLATCRDWRPFFGARVEGAEAIASSNILRLETSGLAMVCLSYFDAVHHSAGYDAD